MTSAQDMASSIVAQFNYNFEPCVPAEFDKFEWQCYMEECMGNGYFTFDYEPLPDSDCRSGNYLDDFLYCHITFESMVQFEQNPALLIAEVQAGLDRFLAEKAKYEDSYN